MFTADMARTLDKSDLDARIERAVRENSKGRGAHMRVYAEDPWCATIADELALRGFTNIVVPNIVLKGDVWFEW